MPDESKLETIPVGSLGIIAHKSIVPLGKLILTLLNGERTARTRTSQASYSTDMRKILI